MMAELFDTPLRSAALGVLIVAAFALVRGVMLGRNFRLVVALLVLLATFMVLLSEGLQ